MIIPLSRYCILLLGSKGLTALGGSRRSPQRIAGAASRPRTAGISGIVFVALALASLALVVGTPSAALAQQRAASFLPLTWLPGGGGGNYVCPNLPNNEVTTTAAGSVATAISADGTLVVGYSNMGASATGTCQAVSWSAGSTTPTPLGFLSGDGASEAFAVNTNGTVIVGMSAPLMQASGQNVYGPTFATMWTGGTATELADLGGCYGLAFGVNGAATGPGNAIVAGADGTPIPSGECNAASNRPTQWINGTNSFFPANYSGNTFAVSADGSTMIGEGGPDPGFPPMPFNWYCRVPCSAIVDIGNFGAPTGTFPDNDPLAVNSNGSVIVGWAVPSNTSIRVAYRWTQATGLVSLDGKLTTNGFASAVNDDGSVIGGQYHFDSFGHAFVWTAAAGVQNLQTLLTLNGVNTGQLGFAPGALVAVTGISADGTKIVGYGNVANGGVEAWIATLLPSAITRTHTHDFNGDGYSDILWEDTGGDTALWLMNGPSILQSAGVGTVPKVWSIAGQRDFNGDGDADILWHDTSGDVAVWLMNGATISQSLGVGTANPGVWSIVGTGDFFGDGNGDILWRDTSGDVAIWELSGNTIVQSCGVGTAPTSWTIAGTGDFNGDGYTDILWHDTSGDVAIWELNGCTIIQSAGVGTVNPSVWSIAGTGDFNGDGKSDILWHDTSGDVAIWEMNGATILQSAGVGTVNPGVWSIAQTGDYYGAGTSDILWRDTSGDVAVWQMNGATITQSAGIGTAPTVWSIQGAGAD